MIVDAGEIQRKKKLRLIHGPSDRFSFKPSMFFNEVLWKQLNKVEQGEEKLSQLVSV